jgi:hypothetical protein
VRKHSLKKLSSKKQCSKSSQCDYKEQGKGKNRLVQLNEFVREKNMLQTIKCSTYADISTNTKRNITNGKKTYETN